MLEQRGDNCLERDAVERIVGLAVWACHTLRLYCDEESRVASKSKKAASLATFLIWLLDLGSNQGPTD